MGVAREKSDVLYEGVWICRFDREEDWDWGWSHKPEKKKCSAIGLKHRNRGVAERRIK